jgi:hypothetical protein
MGWNKKEVWKTILPVLGAIFCYASISFGQPEEILLDNTDSFKGKQRSPVSFKHALHMESLECLKCHHRYEKGENVLDEDELEGDAKDVKCLSCHKEESKTTLKKAFHHQCMGCHMDLRKQGKNTGPELCGQCHPKQ